MDTHSRLEGPSPFMDRESETERRQEIANRIRSLREDNDLTVEDMTEMPTSDFLARHGIISTQ